MGIVCCTSCIILYYDYFESRNITKGKKRIEKADHKVEVVKLGMK